MGNKASKKEYQVAMIGLDDVGKTTILYFLKLGEIVTTVPTKGFNCNTLSIGNSYVTVYDIGGKEEVRKIWGRYYEQSKGIVYVFDGADEERMDEAWKIFDTTIVELETLKLKIPVLILLNKQDLSQSIKEKDFVERFKIAEYMKENDIIIEVEECCAVDGSGLKKGYEILDSHIN